MSENKPDCDCCIHRETCAQYEAGTFCTMFQSVTPPQSDQPDPNSLWREGEEVYF